MKENYKFLEGILPYPTEGEDDIDLDKLLSTGVGADRVSPDESEADKAIRLAAEAADKGGAETEEEKAARIAQEAIDTKGGDEEDNLTLLQGLTADELSDDAKALKKEVLDHFKGEGIDRDGNIIDKDGNIVAEFDKVTKFMDDEPVFDDKGNQVDAEGKIVRTVAQVKFDDSAISGVIADLPYDLNDEDGNPIIYEDTLEGYSKLAKDIGKIEAASQYQELLNSDPELVEIAKHKAAGGTLKTFNAPVDYTKVDIKTLTDVEKTNLVTDSLIASGLDKDRASDIVELYKTNGKLDAEVTKAVSILDQTQKSQQQARDKAYQDSIQAENDRVIAHWGSVKQEIDKGKLGKVDVPKGEQEAFFKYLSTPVNDKGQSQEELDNEAQGLNTDLMMRYYRFKGFNLDKIIKSEVNKSRVSTLKERINKARKSNSHSTSSSSKKQEYDGDISLEQLLPE